MTANAGQVLLMVNQNRGIVDCLTEMMYCKPTYFRGYYVSRFSASRQFRGDLNSR